jgi:Kef-type K+ transport system membrane component KefB
MEVNLKAAEGSLLFLTVLLMVVIGTKLIGCWIATNNGYESSHERVLIMFGVLAQGEMGVVVAAYLFSRGLLNPAFFNVAVIAVVLLTMVSPVLMRMASTKFGVRAIPVHKPLDPKSLIGGGGGKPKEMKNPVKAIKAFIQAGMY